MKGMLLKLIVIGALALVLGGCASFDPFYFRAMPDMDRAIADAKARGADKECPEAFQEVVKMRNDAEDTYWACHTKEAVEKAQGVVEKANGLCPAPPKPMVMAPPAPMDSDGDGVTDDKDRCPGTPMGVTVDMAGCPLDSDGDGVYDTNDKCPGTPKGAKVDTAGCWNIEPVYFEFDRSDILPRYVPVLDAVLDVLKQNPDLQMEINGYTDGRGADKYNDKLSVKRAEAVKQYFVEQGIAAERLEAAGFGKMKAVSSNATDEGRAHNRRVELHPFE